MSQSKIEFRLGNIHFVGEGDKEWVTKQLDKIISKAPSLLNSERDLEEKYSAPAKHVLTHSARETKANKSEVVAVRNSGSAKDLTQFIQANKAGANQRLKFLATAIWLNKNGKSNLVTRDVTNALKASRVPALINPSQYLTQNVKQGYLKKSGNHFLLTKKATTAL